MGFDRLIEQRMVGIDAGNSLDRPATGVAVYARNLTVGLARLRPDERFAWFYRSNRYFRSFRTRLPKNAQRRLLEGPVMNLRTRRLRLFHGLNQRLPAGLSVPTVATFHDLFALTGEFSTPDFRERFAGLARETARRADHIIAVSGHTATQVAERLQFPASRITVVHHGAEPIEIPSRARRAEILTSLGVATPFVLNLGALQVRKNIGRIVQSFELGGGSTRLVLAGSHGFGATEILDRIRISRVRDRILLVGHVDDEVRATLYAEAEALLFPSLDEGFGLPVVEAFAAGLPVITSNVSALPEVAGDAAVLVDPYEPEEIADALKRVLDDSDLRAELRQKGLARAKSFTWQRCADETWKVYNLLS